MKKSLAILLLVVLACTAAVMSSDVTVTWEHGGASNTVQGYNMYYGPTSRNYTNVVTTGYVTNTVISNLPLNSFISGTTIGFDNLETEFGNEMQYTNTVPLTNGLPSAVTDFQLKRVEQHIY